MQRIDAHHHVWDLAVRDQPWMSGDGMGPIRRSYGIDEFVAEAAASGVGASVVVQTVTEITESEELLDLAADTPQIVGVVGWADLAAVDVGQQLDRLQSMRSGRWLVGIRSMVQYEPDPAWLQRPAVLAGLREVARRGLVNELLVLPGQLDAVTVAVREVPDGRFVLDHMAKPPIATTQWEPWATDLAEVAKCDNVVVKLSGLVTEAGWSTWTPALIRPYVEQVISVFGAGRILFGSDWPVCTLAASYGQVVALADDLIGGLSATQHEAIFGGNATATYTLDTTLLEAP